MQPVAENIKSKSEVKFNTDFEIQAKGARDFQRLNQAKAQFDSGKIVYRYQCYHNRICGAHA